MPLHFDSENILRLVETLVKRAVSGQKRHAQTESTSQNDSQDQANPNPMVATLMANDHE